jgi:hypothetical protein
MWDHRPVRAFGQKGSGEGFERLLSPLEPSWDTTAMVKGPVLCLSTRYRETLLD